MAKPFGSYLLSRNQRAALTPHTALKKSTSTGVMFPSVRPSIPLLALMGKTMKSITRDGPTL